MWKDRKVKAGSFLTWWFGENYIPTHETFHEISKTQAVAAVKRPSSTGKRKDEMLSLAVKIPKEGWYLYSLPYTSPYWVVAEGSWKTRPGSRFEINDRGEGLDKKELLNDVKRGIRFFIARSP